MICAQCGDTIELVGIVLPKRTVHVAVCGCDRLGCPICAGTGKPCECGIMFPGPGDRYPTVGLHPPHGRSFWEWNGECPICRACRRQLAQRTQEVARTHG